MYYHVRQGSDIYPQGMQRNHMVGILWQNLAQYQTWFGPAAYMVHAIQIIPVTPVTESLLPPDFVAQELPVLAQSCDASPRCEEEGWKPFATMAKAIVDPARAWEEARALPSHTFSSDSPAGNGNSRLNTLYWIATREPGANPEGKALLSARAAIGGHVGGVSHVAALLGVCLLALVAAMGWAYRHRSRSENSDANASLISAAQ